MAPAFADIGKAAKDLLSGNPKSGSFPFDPKLGFTSTTASGVAFTVSAVKKGEKVDGSVKVAYSTKKYAADATVDPAGKVATNLSVSNLAPGLKLSTSATLPNIQSAKLAVDYGIPYLGLKATVGLTSAPVVDVNAATGYKNVVVGGEVAYDTAKSSLSKYNVGVGYNAPDFQVGAFLTDKATVVKAVYSHTVNSTSVVGAEVVKKVAGSDAPSFTLGYSKKLANGALAKLKIDNAGALAALYETKLASGEKVAGALQVQTTDLSKPAKFGFAIDLF